MKRLKKSLAFITTIFMLATLSACNSDNKESSKEESTVETTAEITTEAVTEEETTEAPTEATTEKPTEPLSELSETQKLIVDILQAGFESSFGENMKIYYEEDKSNYVISIWQDGLAANLENEAAADAWSAMIDTLVSAVGQMTDPIRQIDSTANVTLNILNDENQKDILLTIYNGEVSSNIIDSETKPKEKTSEKSESDKTVPKEYTNALKKAKSYSDNMYMSKAAIHDQLTSEYGEGFSEEAADYAMENLVADYKANALHKAKSYQDNMAMSTSAIYDQLVSEYGEQFTEEEAQYAIDNLD